MNDYNAEYICNCACFVTFMICCCCVLVAMIKSTSK